MPYQASRWRHVFHAKVATRSPSRMPALSRCCAKRSARAKLSVGRRVKRAFYRACDDRSPGVIGPGMVDDAMAKERPVLHQPEHRVPHSPCILQSKRLAQRLCNLRRRGRIRRGGFRSGPRSKVSGMSQPRNRRICRATVAAQPNRPRENRAMSWDVVPMVARSARISPITGANLKPWPEQGEATMILEAPGRRSMRKSPSGVMV